MKLSVRGIDYHIRCEQQPIPSPQIVMLHGFMGSGASFDFLRSYLDCKKHIICIDLLGHGNTGNASSVARFSVDEQLKDLKNIFDQLNLSSFYLYGYSMGGRLALRYALRYQQALLGLILESTHEGIKNKQKRKEREKIDEEWGEQIKQDYHKFLEWWQELSLFQVSADLPGERHQYYKKIQKNQKPEQMAMSLKGFGQGSISPVTSELDNLEIPVLLGAGNDDSKYVKRMQKMHNKLSHSQYRRIPGAAHRIHLDAPKQWALHIGEFITI